MANEILWTLVNTALRSIAVLGIRKVFKSMDRVRRLCLGLLLVVGLHGLTTVLVTVLCQAIGRRQINGIGTISITKSISAATASSTT